MLISFDEIIGITLHHEGGYVHDPKDLGGETNFGIAKRFYPRCRYQKSYRRWGKRNLQRRLLG